MRKPFIQHTTGEDTPSTEREVLSGPPRWAVVIGIIVIVIVVAALSLMLIGVSKKLPGSPLPAFGKKVPSLAMTLVTVVVPVLAGTFVLGILGARLLKRTDGLRKFLLTTHVMISVSWLGVTAVLLALGFVEWTSQENEMVRAAIVALAVTAGYVAVPLSLASLFTGLVSSLSTSWGLFRHYWIVLKLLMAVSTAVIWLLYAAELSAYAGIVSTLSGSLQAWRNPSPMLHALGALLLLGLSSVLSMYKPVGMTHSGQRQESAARDATTSKA